MDNVTNILSPCNLLVAVALFGIAAESAWSEDAALSAPAAPAENPLNAEIEQSQEQLAPESTELDTANEQLTSLQTEVQAIPEGLQQAQVETAKASEQLSIVLEKMGYCPS